MYSSNPTNAAFTGMFAKKKIITYEANGDF
jgi:hypothetical protein